MIRAHPFLHVDRVPQQLVTVHRRQAWRWLRLRLAGEGLRLPRQLRLRPPDRLSALAGVTDVVTSGHGMEIAYHNRLTSQGLF
jgi:hypothetical protein